MWNIVGVEWHDVREDSRRHISIYRQWQVKVEHMPFGQLVSLLTPGLLPEKFESLVFGQGLFDVIMNSTDEKDVVGGSNTAILPLNSHVLHSGALEQIGHRR